MARIEPGGPIVAAVAVGLFGVSWYFGAVRLGPCPEPERVNLPVVYSESGRAVGEPVERHTTLCPTPEQKEAAFSLPEPARLPHMDNPRELDDPGPPAVPVEVGRAAIAARLRALLAEVEDGRLP